MTLTGDTEAKNTVRLRGYSIRVSNTSDVSPGLTEACFTDAMSKTLPTVIQEECRKTTKYIWFHQLNVRRGDDKAPILEICEVQVFGKLTYCILVYITIVLNIKHFMLIL